MGCEDKLYLCMVQDGWDSDRTNCRKSCQELACVYPPTDSIGMLLLAQLCRPVQKALSMMLCFVMANMFRLQHCDAYPLAMLLPPP